MRNAIAFGISSLLCLALLPSVSRAAPVSLEATDNATVQPPGPRSGSSGKDFFNIEGSMNGNFASFGVVEFDFTGLTGSLGGDVSSVSGISVSFTEFNASFSLAGPMSFYLTQQNTVSIQPVVPPALPAVNYIAGMDGLGSVDADLAPLSLLGSGTYDVTANGTVETFALNFAGADLAYLLGQVNAGSKLRLVITPDAPTTAATYAGFSHNTFAGPTINFNAVVSGLPFWDVNGAAAGLGGTGTWDTTTPLFNDETGIGTPFVFNPAKLTVFGGTAGTVTVAPGGITTDGGIQFDTDGYTVTGAPLTLGTINSINVSNATDTTTINSMISGANGLRKIGNGTLVLGSATNDFTGEVAINGGNLSIASDANLGPTTNGITFGGGTLKSTLVGNLQLDAGRAISGAAGGIDVAAGSTVTVNGAVNTTGALTLRNAGTVALAGGSKTLGGLAFTTTGTLNAGSSFDAVSLGGSINANNTSGTATLNGSVNFGAAATSISVPNIGGTLVVTGGIVADGRITINGAGTVDIQGDNTAAVGGFTIGSVGNPGPTVLLHDSNSLGTGTLGTVELRPNSGTLQALVPVTIPKVVSIGATGATPANTLNFAGANTEVAGAVSLFKPATGPNRFRVNNNTTFSGGWNVSTGSATNTTAGVVVGGTGVLNLSGTLAIDVPVTVDGATVNVNSANTKNVASLTVSGGGRLNLNAANAFAGDTSAPPVPSNVALNGGTLGTGGSTQTFGTLAAQANSTVDLGPEAITVQFANSSAVAWTGGVRFANWSGNPMAGNGSDQVLVGTNTTGLTGGVGGQLSSVKFAGYATGAISPDNDGEIIPASSTIVFRLGDFDFSGTTNVGDIPVMLAALTNLTAYQAAGSPLHTAYPNALTSLDVLDVGDFNSDGVVSNTDIQALLTLVGGGGGGLAAVPEPSSLMLCGLALPALLLAVRRRRLAA